jgi:small subunit ribosomal protein S16
MLNIRLSRVGKRNYAQYKIVVAEKTSPVKGKFVEQLGSYDPHTKEVIVKEDRVKYWIGNGAGCSDTVYNLLVENKVIEGEKRKLALKSKKKDDGGEEKEEKKESGVEEGAKKEEEADKAEEADSIGEENKGDYKDKGEDEDKEDSSESKEEGK